MPMLKGTFDKYDAWMFGQALCGRIIKIDYEKLTDEKAHQIASMFRTLAIEIDTDTSLKKKED